MNRKIEISNYEIKLPPEKLYTGEGERIPVRAAIVSDLHGRPYNNVLSVLKELSPDLILAPGDIIENGQNDHKLGIPFLAEAVRLAPVYYSSGNHEKTLSDTDIEAIGKAGVRFTDGRVRRFTKGAAKISIGGLPPAVSDDDKYRKTTIFNMFSHGKTDPRSLTPDTDFLSDFSSREGCKLMLCHHPEYYEPLLRELDIDIICSGHAHGGQVRLFGHGIFAPGQGFFPKYTCGVYDGRLVVSRGLVNHSFAPRLFNPPHIIVLTIS